MSEYQKGDPHDEWIKVTLGDIAINFSENEYDPTPKGLSRCVGLEHLDPGSLQIKRWSKITPEMSFTRKFSRGQLLIGKRRAYQKKVALADFDGICSSDILVIAAKKNTNFVQDLLPFILQDDRFFDYAVGTSSGSLSPRTKWKFLADYEIWLPSLDEQRRIATTLWAAEDCIMKCERFVAAAERAKQVLMRELFSKGIGHTQCENREIGVIPKEWEIKELNTILQEKIINGYPGAESNIENIVKILTLTAVTNNDVSIKYTKEIRVDPHLIKEYWIEKGDIFIGRGNTPELVGLATLNQNEDSFAIFPDLLIRIRPNQEIVHPKFLIEYLLSPFVRTYFSRNSKGTAGSMRKIDQKIIERLLVPLPSLPEQRQIASILTLCDETIAAARANVEATRALKMRLIHEMLTPE